MVPAPVLAAVTSLLRDRLGNDTALASPRPVGGGCINPSARLETTGGRPFFLKWNDSADPEMFSAEADGLKGLAAPGALRVPEVMGRGGSCTRSDPGWLLLEFIPTGPANEEYGTMLGKGLAALHGAGSAEGPATPEGRTASLPAPDPTPFQGTFGWLRDNFIGSLPQENRGDHNWARFWRDRRMAPQVARARDGGHFLGREGKDLDALLDRMESILPKVPEAGPALLHGDLWSGNYFADEEGNPVLIDPAVYRGDGEVDLAMMELFGSFPRGFLEAYDHARGLSPRYREYGRDLYQLYYLLVHVNLFGESYLSGSLAAARRVLAAAT